MSLLERIYFLHAELSANRYPNSKTLIEAFEISQPTARRDFAYLRDRLLAPLAFDHQQNGFYYTQDDFNLPFENSPRIVFLLGMLSRLAEETGLSGLPEIRQLEKRLASMVGQEDGHITESIHCEWVEVEHPDPAIFDTIIEAVVKKRQLRIAYRSPAKKTTERLVEPLKLINYQGRWYLSAWCLLRRDRRMFHLARIGSAELGEKANAAIAATAKAADNLDRSFGIFKGPPRYIAEILFTGTAAELVKNQVWHRDQRLSARHDGVIMRLPVHDDREILMKILQYGAQAEVRKPAHLYARVQEEIAKLSSIYGREAIKNQD